MHVLIGRRENCVVYTQVSLLSGNMQLCISLLCREIHSSILENFRTRAEPLDPPPQLTPSLPCHQSH
ncbi:unnamed protein product [Staurois parvus]|uniref:Uncharacterized protein n=1 Tax=Staurois parvus TaxID=386267 RepID=A0ABN9H4K0_9NEOB|nr:unnamed protein product [Staurois parvus]